MPLAPGTRLGPYEIQSIAGAGGMGEVYKGKDTRLDRVVAIKVLPRHLATDAQMRDRFEREARAISSLNHRNICALYDVGQAPSSSAGQGPVDFLVMEFLDGETLADRIARGRVPLDQALVIARQIAEALEAAHDHAIVHRDLKPDNVRMTADGTVKVLDFGLAKILEPVSRSDLSQSPTVMATQPGFVIGTAAYMSPEQANGMEADRASDVWAFACVLFEMLTGHRAFDGATTSEMIANVLKTEPNWQLLPAGTPDSVRRVLRRGLQKNQKLRLRDIHDLRLELEDVQDAKPEAGRQITTAPSRRGERIAWASVVALLAVAAGVFAARALRPRTVPPEARLEINTPLTRSTAIALSPDGSRIVFVAPFEGQSRLWLRTFDSPMARPIAGTERALRAFWSPDGKSLAFYADSKLKRVDIDSGSVKVLASSAVPIGGAWNGAGIIVYADSPGAPLYRIPADGGEPVAATRLDAPAQRGHGSPQFLPDGRHFVFYVTGSAEARGVYVGGLDSLESTRLFSADTPAAYVAPGALLFIRERKLTAQRFDADRLTLTGTPFVVADDVPANTTVTASAAGPIAYRIGPPDSGQKQLVWVDRAGRELRKVTYPDTAAIAPAMSPDGRRIAAQREPNSNMDIWAYDVVTGAWDWLTSSPGDDIFPLWSRDGTSLLYGGARDAQGTVKIYRKRLSAPQDSEELLVETIAGGFPIDLSPDGRFLLYDRNERGVDMWAVSLEGNGTGGRKPFEVLRTDFNEGMAQFSPDGKWIAYQSDRTGRPEIYLRPFMGPGDDRRVSIDGGAQVRWNPNGRELFFIGGDDRLMAASIQFSADGKTVDSGGPTALFAANSVGSTVALVYRQQYLVSTDGQSFVLNSTVGEGRASPITVILNWEPKDR